MTIPNRDGRRRRAWRLGAAASLSIPLVLASCGPATIPVIDPLPPPPPGADVRTGDQFLAPPVPREIGKLPEAPQPRFGVALFEYPRSGAGSTAQHSPVRTAEVANRLELSKLFARAIRLESSPVIEAGADVAASGALLAAEPDAKGVDILVSGTVLSGGNTEVRLAAHDTRDGRLVARSEFEGGDRGAVLDKAVEDILTRTASYWFELGRGTLTRVDIEAAGLREAGEVKGILEALGALPGVRLARHISTTVWEGTATASYALFFSGDQEALAERAAEARWRTAGGGTGSLRRGDGFRFQTVYE